MSILMSNTLLQFSFFLKINFRFEILSQISQKCLLSLLHILNSSLPSQKLSLNFRLLILKKGDQSLSFCRWFIIPCLLLLFWTGTLQRILQILLFMLPYCLDIKFLSEFSDFFQSHFFLLEKWKQNLRLIPLLHFFIEMRFTLQLQLILYLFLLFLLLSSLLQILLYFRYLFFFFLFSQFLFKESFALFFLFKSTLLFLFSFFYSTLSLLFFLLYLSNLSLVLFFCKYFLKLNRSAFIMIQLCSFSSKLFIKILLLLNHQLSLGFDLQFMLLIKGQFRLLFPFHRQWSNRLNDMQDTSEISNEPFFSDFATSYTICWAILFAVSSFFKGIYKFLRYLSRFQRFRFSIAYFYLALRSSSGSLEMLRIPFPFSFFAVSAVSFFDESFLPIKIKLSKQYTIKLTLSAYFYQKSFKFSILCL